MRFHIIPDRSLVIIISDANKIYAFMFLSIISVR